MSVAWIGNRRIPPWIASTALKSQNSINFPRLSPVDTVAFLSITNGAGYVDLFAREAQR
jgi:hypothetical protein